VDQEQLQREILDQAYEARPEPTADLGAWVDKGFVAADVFEAAAERLVALHLVTRQGGTFRTTVPHGENVARLLQVKGSIGFADLERIGELSEITPAQRVALQKIAAVLMGGGEGATVALEVCRWLGLDLQT